MAENSNNNNNINEKATRLAEKQKKPYSGFITDDELRNSMIIDPEEIRKTGAYDSAGLKETRIYQGLGSGLDSGRNETLTGADGSAGSIKSGNGLKGLKGKSDDTSARESAGDSKMPERIRRGRKVSFRIADSNKFRRLIAILVIFALILAFDISFLLMKSGIKTLPARTEKAKAEAAELQAENKRIAEESAQYGNYDDVKDLKESWERLKEKIAE